ncbi:MAG: bile acid:sodium symporter family protein [Alphaproteobacteria bacterium]|nr:bile acid:sodium symporter family protein [Alphaproteobacteria bacterium]
MDAAALDAARIELAPGGDWILPLILAVIMFSVALSLRPRDFLFLMAEPGKFAGAAAAQIVALPAMTLGLIYLINPVPSIALGMIVVACCPGGNVSNFFTQLGRGDTALSVALTGTSSLAAALLTPVSILFWTSLYAPTAILVDEIAVSPWAFVIQTTLILAIPLALGMAFAFRYPAMAARIRPALMIAALAGILAMVFGGLAANWALLTATAGAVLAIVIAHNGLAFATGAAAGRLLRYNAPRRRALTFEVGIQNAGLGLVILLSQFDGLGGAAAVVGVWSIWHLFAGLGLAGALRLYDARWPTAEAEPAE